jgi:hypothetical protein
MADASAAVKRDLRKWELDLQANRHAAKAKDDLIQNGGNIVVLSSRVRRPSLFAFQCIDFNLQVNSTRRSGRVERSGSTSSAAPKDLQMTFARKRIRFLGDSVLQPSTLVIGIL